MKLHRQLAAAQGASLLQIHPIEMVGRARDELDTLAQVISANLTRAALEAAPVIADLSSWLADVAGMAGIAWERLFDAPEEKSLRTLRYELDLASSTIEKLEGRIRELRESPTLGFTTFIDIAQINAIETKLDELRRARDQTQARIAFLEGPPDTGAPAPVSAPAPDDTTVTRIPRVSSASMPRNSAAKVGLSRRNPSRNSTLLPSLITQCWASVTSERLKTELLSSSTRTQEDAAARARSGVRSCQ